MALKRIGRKAKRQVSLREMVANVNQVFTDMADAIRERTGNEAAILPEDMGNEIRSLVEIELAETPERTLPAVFQDVADALRSGGALGTITPTEMPVKIQKVGINDTLEIQCEDTFTGKTLYCRGLYNGELATGAWALASGFQYATINQNGRVDINAGVQNQSIIVTFQSHSLSATKTITVSYDNQLTIEGPDSMSGESGTVVARYNGAVVTPTWSVTSGGANATISNGAITILQTGNITVQATYNTYTATKTISVEYVANKSQETVVGDDGSITVKEEVVVENQDGSTTTQTTSTTTNEDGSFSQTETSTTENQDGSSSTTSTTTNSDGTSSETTSTTTAPDQSGATTTTSSTIHYDENGDESGSTEMERQTNADGSSTATTTDYDANGDPTNQVNESVDTDGNAATQNVAYDENGDPKVTGYTIDTTNNEDGYKELDQNGVNTEFYGFDSVEGFVMNIHFTIDFTDQPPNQNEGLHNVLTMKRANPSPWYGFQIRHAGTGKYVQLGTQFEFGSNTNTAINPTSANWIVTNQIAEYNI